MERAGVDVQGLQGLLDGFKQIGDGLPTKLSVGLRAIAKDVATDARSIAEQQGLRASGDLIKGVTTSVRGTTAYIVDTARRVSPKYPEGYPYSAVYEYGHNGERAFVHPAIARDEDKVVDAIEQLVERLIADAGFH